MLQVIFEAPIVRGLGGLKRLVLLAPLGQRVPGLGRVSSTPKHAHIEPTRSSSKAPRIPFLQSPYKVGSLGVQEGVQDGGRQGLGMHGRLADAPPSL